MKFVAILSAVAASVTAASVVQRSGTHMTQAAAQAKDEGSHWDVTYY
ncbi:hypothetical protein RSAG8_06980, partial [Rhizoctonia solani AG-8 WAC10335]